MTTVAPSVLMVVTNHGDIDGTPMTGVWFSEFSEPFDILIATGADVTVASPRGGPAPVDPRGYPSREDIAAVRDSLAALLDVRLSDRSTLLHGRRVTGFTRGEDERDELFRHMPFSLQDRMTSEGAEFVEHPPGAVHVETDGWLITGQNPASAIATAEAFLRLVSSGGRGG